ncbi:MAG: TIGR02147 family protein [Bdellovibrionales bacterium]
MVSIYEYDDYRTYLQAALPVKGAERGARNRLAEVLNCQKGFISQVLSGKNHFSLEHGARISQFLKLDETEEEFFLLLLHLGRAGSKELEKFYQKRIALIRERRRQVHERIRAKSDLSESEQAIYYSSWHYTAVHMCLMIPHLRTKTAISKTLGVSTVAVNRVIEFLISVGLAKDEGDKISSGPARSHLSAESPLVAKHHVNWRMRAIDSLDHIRPRDLHYSLVMSISENAAEKIREILLKAIQENEPIMKAAEDKTIYALNLDLFAIADRIEA